MGALFLHTFGKVYLKEAGIKLRVSPRILIMLAVLDAERHHFISRQHLISLIWEAEPTRRRRHSLTQLLYSIRRLSPDLRLIDERGHIKLVGLWSDRQAVLASDSISEAVAIMSEGDYLESLGLGNNDTLAEWRDQISAKCKQHAISLGHSALACVATEHNWGEVTRIAKCVLTYDPYDARAWEYRLRGLAAEGAIGRAQGEAASVRLLYRNDLCAPLPQSLETVIRRVNSLLPLRSTDLPTNRLHCLPFAGRTEELRIITDAIASAGSTKTSQLLYVTGPGGIGKTSVVERALRSAAIDGAEYLPIACGKRSRRAPFNALAQVIRATPESFHAQVAPEWRALLASVGDRAYQGVTHGVTEPLAIYEAVHRLLKGFVREIGTLAVWIDDAHWMDSASAGALSYIMTRLVDEPLTWILSARLDVLGENDRLLATWGQLQHRRYTTIRLTGLHIEDVRDALEPLLDDLAPPTRSRLINAAYRSSAGNPLLVNLWLAERRQTDSEPLNIGEHVLPPDELDITKALAVLGGTAAFSVVQEVTRLSQDRLTVAISRLADRGVLSTTSATVGFSHDLIRERMEAELTGEEHAELNRKVVSALQRAESRSAVAIAHYALQSGEDHMACALALEAADECLGTGAYREAEFFLHSAIERSSEVDLSAAALRKLGNLYLDREHLKEAKMCFDQLPTELYGRDDWDVHAYLELRTELATLIAPAADVAARAVQFVTRLQGNCRQDLLAHALCTAIEAAHDAGHRDFVCSVVEHVDNSWSTYEEPRIRAYIAGVTARILGVYGDLHRASVWVDRALRSAAESQDALIQSRSWATAGTVHTLAGHVQRAVDDFELAENFAQSPPVFHYRQRILNNFGVALIEGGRIDEARAKFVEALAGATGHDLLFLLGNLAYTDFLLGRHVEAVQHAEAMRAINAVFQAEWAQKFAMAMLVTASSIRVSGEEPSLDFADLFRSGMHHLVLHNVFTNAQCGIDSAGLAAIRAEISAKRGQDLLARIRLRTMLAILAPNNFREGRRLGRLASWARRRGACLVAKEIEHALALCSSQARFTLDRTSEV